MEEANEMEKLPEGWKRVNLGDMTYFKAVGSGIDYFTGYKNYLSTNSVQGKKITHIEEIITFKNRPSRANMQPKKDRVAFAKMRNTIKVLLIDEKLEKDYILSTGFALLETTINPKFIYQYLLSPFFNKQKDIFAEGTTQEAISNDDFDKIYITFPELKSEQQKIAEILETVDNAIEKTDKIIEKYKRIKQGLMQDVLTKGIDEKGNIRSEKTHKFKDSPLGRIPEEWEVVRLGEIGEIIYGERLNEYEYVENGSSIVYGTTGIISRSEKYLGIGETIILPRKGSINNKFYVEKGQKFFVIDTAFYLKFNSKETLNIKYLFYFLNRINLELLNEATGVPSLNRENLKNILLTLPPLPEQQRTASILSNIDETIEKEEQYKEKLKRIKQGLMEDLLTGKVRVNHLIKSAVICQEERGNNSPAPSF